MHANAVKRGWVEKARDWPWLRWRFYYLGDTSLLAMDYVPSTGDGAKTGNLAGAQIAFFCAGG